jgi:uncharacterized alkaline shock family protein YloU
MSTGTLGARPSAPSVTTHAGAGDGPKFGQSAVPGSIRIGGAVVAKLAARAALEIPDAGGAAPRVFGRSLPGAGHLGIRRTGLSVLPRASAQVDGQLAFIKLVVSVRWPANVTQVAAAVRAHVRDRVQALTDMTVTTVDIEVTALGTDLPSEPRVQ